MDPNKRALQRLSKALKQRTAKLAVAKLQLKDSVIRRKNVEQALKTSGIHCAKLLKESLLLQAGLRKLTHQVLRVQENDRKHLSRELQDKIAQSLLGINVRLLSLKEEASGNTKGLKQEIVATQKLVTKSARAVRRVARKFGGL